MRYIKTFEDLNDEPEIGDFVLCDGYKNNLDRYKRCENKIGKIMEISQGLYRVHYKYFGSLYFSREEIIAHSKNIEDIEMRKDANIYNL